MVTNIKTIKNSKKCDKSNQSNEERYCLGKTKTNQIKSRISNY